MNVTMIVGQFTTFTATLLDSSSNPITDVDPSLIVWTIQHNPYNINQMSRIASINPSNKGQTVTGSLVQVHALAPGSCNITATYNNHANQTFVYTIALLVNAPAVNSISVVQGSVS